METIEKQVMRASDSRILIVSGAQGCIGYENILRRNNFRNINTCSDGITGLQKMEHETPDVLIMDADMPDMDGFELASNVREIERADHRFTYIVLISNELHNKIEFSWQANVDAIIPREAVPFRLVPQVMSGERLAGQTNRLLHDNLDLSAKCGYLEAGQLLDPLTGLGNRRQAMKGMEDTIRQIEARGGAVALLLVKLMNVNEIIKQNGQAVFEELVVAVGDKIRRLVRPLDIVTYFDKGTFAIVMRHDELTHCQESSYERIRAGLVLKSYQTRAGFLQPQINIGACGAGAETGPPKTGCLVATAMSNLSGESEQQLKVTVLDPFQEAQGIK